MNRESALQLPVCRVGKNAMKKNADKNIDDLTSEDIRTFLTPHKSAKEKTASGLSDETLAEAIRTVLQKGRKDNS